MNYRADQLLQLLFMELWQRRSTVLSAEALRSCLRSLAGRLKLMNGTSALRRESKRHQIGSGIVFV